MALAALNAKFLQNRGPGIHHLCFEVDDIEAECARLRGLGVRLLSERLSRPPHLMLPFWPPPLLSTAKGSERGPQDLAVICGGRASSCVQK